MGYHTNFDGEITITPPLNHREVMASRFSSPNAWELDLNVKLRVTKTQEETDQGVLTSRWADAVIPVYDDAYKGYDVIEHVQEIIDAHPDHDFTGYLECAGEDAGDIWRLVICDRKAMRVNPEITWPEI